MSRSDCKFRWDPGTASDGADSLTWADEKVPTQRFVRAHGRLAVSGYTPELFHEDLTASIESELGAEIDRRQLCLGWLWIQGGQQPRYRTAFGDGPDPALEQALNDWVLAGMPDTRA